MEEEDEEKEKTGGRGGPRCSSAADAWVAGDHLVGSWFASPARRLAVTRGRGAPPLDPIESEGAGRSTRGARGRGTREQWLEGSRWLEVIGESGERC